MATSYPYGSDPYQRRGSPLSRGFLPLALITLGVVFLLSNLVPERSRGGLIVLGLGAAFMIGRFTTGRYGYAVPAGILAAIGAFIIVHDTQRGIGGAGLFFVLLGLGFVLVYAIGLRPGAVWPMFPGVILVALGLVLLGVSTLAPLASFSWIAAYWPLALVLLGVWLLFRDTLPAPMRRPLGTLGGLALLAYGLLAAAASVAAGGTLERSGVVPGFDTPPFADVITRDAPLSAGQTFTVTNSNGATSIHGSSSGSTVRVSTTRHFSVGGQSPDVRLVPNGQGIRLDAATRRGFPFGSSSSVDYDVELPAGANIVAQSSSGAISVTNVDGDVRITSSSGSIQASQLQHLRQAQTSSGTIILDGVFTDAAQVSASSGAVKIRLDPGSAEQLDVHTGSGTIEPQGGLLLSGGETRRDTLTGAIGAPAPGAVLSVHTSSGSVVVSQ